MKTIYFLKLGFFIVVGVGIIIIILPVLSLNIALLQYRSLALPEQLSSNAFRMNYMGLYGLSVKMFDMFPTDFQEQIQMEWTKVRVERLTKQTEEQQISTETWMRIDKAYLAGEITPQTDFERELIALSCITAVKNSSNDSACDCLQKVNKELPGILAIRNLENTTCGMQTAMSGSLDKDIYIAKYIPELNQFSNNAFNSMLSNQQIQCPDALEYIRKMVQAYGGDSLQNNVMDAYLKVCPGTPETWYYQAMGSELMGDWQTALSYYERSAMPPEHQETFIAWVDFLARLGDCNQALEKGNIFSETWQDAKGSLYSSEAFKGCELLAQGVHQTCKPLVIQYEAEDMFSGPPGSGIVEALAVSDPQASGGKARKGTIYSGWLVAGPWITLPYGRYKVDYYIRTEQIPDHNQGIWIDVASSDVNWREEEIVRTLWGSETNSSNYQPFTITFTHNGEGLLQFRVKALTIQPVWIDKIVITNLDCE